MPEVESFKIDHRVLIPGIYLQQGKGKSGTLTNTFDIRMVAPKDAEHGHISLPVIHSIEHLLAIYFRFYFGLKDSVVYVGPMGCGTGFYLVTLQGVGVCDVRQGLKELVAHLPELFNHEEPNEHTCGNHKLHNFTEARKFLEKLLGSGSFYSARSYQYLT